MNAAAFTDKTLDAQKLFSTAMTDVLVRWTQAMEEFAKVETRTAEQVRGAMDECGRLAKAQLEYGLKLSADFRKLSVQTLEKAATATAPAAPVQSV